MNSQIWVSNLLPYGCYTCPSYPILWHSTFPTDAICFPFPSYANPNLTYCTCDLHRTYRIEGQLIICSWMDFPIANACLQQHNQLTQEDHTDPSIINWVWGSLLLHWRSRGRQGRNPSRRPPLHLSSSPPPPPAAVRGRARAKPGRRRRRRGVFIASFGRAGAGRLTWIWSRRSRGAPRRGPSSAQVGARVCGWRDGMLLGGARLVW